MSDSLQVSIPPSSAESAQWESASDIAPSGSFASDLPTMRVLHVINGEHFAGAERVQMHLGRCLPQSNVYADFVCLKQGKFESQFNLQQSRMWVESMRGRWDFSVASRIAERAVDGWQLIHAHTPRSAMVACKLSSLLGVPWVYHIHSPARSDSDRFWMNRVNAWGERLSLRTVRHQIAVSSSLRNHAISAGYSPTAVSVVHNGVPCDHHLRASTPTVGGPWRLGMVALMRPRKGLEVVLKSVAQLRSAGLPITFRCIGPFETDAYRHSIQQVVKQWDLNDVVEFLGFTEDIPRALSELDIMVLPSLYGEGLPMVVLEAMAAGVPVVATRVEGTPEAIDHGVEGLLAEPGSAESLSDQLQNLLSGQYDWSAMSRAAKQRHRTQFSDHAMAAAVAKVYRKVLD